MLGFSITGLLRAFDVLDMDCGHYPFLFCLVLTTGFFVLPRDHVQKICGKEGCKGIWKCECQAWVAGVYSEGPGQPLMVPANGSLVMTPIH